MCPGTLCKKAIANHLSSGHNQSEVWSSAFKINERSNTISRNQSLTKVVFVMPFIHIFKDPYRTSYQKSVILHFQTFSSNLLDFYIVSFLPWGIGFTLSLYHRRSWCQQERKRGIRNRKALCEAGMSTDLSIRRGMDHCSSKTVSTIW